MEIGSRAIAAGAHYVLAGSRPTMLASRKPVIAVCAVRTGCGKSQTSRFVSAALREQGWKVAVVRHPMPYGDLAAQAVQRFAEVADLDRHRCTIEEREEYEPHLENGSLVFAGVDYHRILAEAEAEADVILWDGGNNDLPFFRPDLHIVVTDPLRPGHETTYYPGMANLLMADVFVINKDGSIRIFVYPYSVFPPTDFHSATLVGDDIYIIGCLGYWPDRKKRPFPVYKLSIHDFHIEHVPTYGDMPASIYDHAARLVDEKTIEISEGKIQMVNGDNEIIEPNYKIYRLDVGTMRWTASST
jgi:hypothetical protein